MHRFFAERLGEDLALLSPDEAAHAVKVLRMTAGEECQAIIEGRLFSARLENAEGPVRVRLIREMPSPEPSVRITLYQGLPKGDKMDWIVQKCTEAGVCRIVPVLFSRCVAKWETKDAEKKLPRWRRIAAEAGKQSGRAVIPQIEAPLTVPQMAQALKEYDLALAPWEEEKGRGISKVLNGQKSVAVVIGPEGGIAQDEMETMRRCGAAAVSLGPRIFRTETAGLAAVISLLTLTGDME